MTSAIRSLQKESALGYNNNNNNNNDNNNVSERRRRTRPPAILARNGRLLPASGWLPQGKSPEAIGDDVVHKTLPLCLENAKLWLPANLIIYSVPLSYRVLVTNLTDFVWVIILSNLKKAADEAQATEQPQVQRARRTAMAASTAKRGYAQARNGQ
jgi:hypothetical protein